MQESNTEQLRNRPVLSFVRRSGRLDARLQRAWDRYAGEYLLDVNAGEGLLNVRPGVTIDDGYVHRTWGNDNPLIVEIGTGQGENIVAAAAGHPDVNFLALEVYDPGVAHTMLLAGKQGLGNLRIAQATCASRRSTPPNCSRSWPTAWWPRCGRTSPIRGPRCGITSAASCSPRSPGRSIARWCPEACGASPPTSRTMRCMCTR